MAVQDELAQFTIVGENIHTTRSVSRKSPRFAVLEDGKEGIRFRDAAEKLATSPYLKAFASRRPISRARSSTS